MDPTANTEIVSKLIKQLKDNYVFPDLADKICLRLEKGLANGEYNGITEGEFLAYTLTTHMQEMGNDEHLWVRWHPVPLPSGGDALRLNQDWLEDQRREAELDNFGFRKVERLAGNVGYLDIRKFHKVEWAGETAAAAMNFVANTSALIIDLRKCLGGFPGMVALVSSYLFGNEPVHLSSIYWREEDFTQQYWTSPYVPGKRFIDKPVFLVIGKDTFSAGEGFAYSLRNLQRATLIGETTDGGAHPGASYRLHAHFEAFIPVGKTIDPISRENWQGIGVIPDISVPTQDAFQVAYRLALKTIIKDLNNPESKPLRLLLVEAQAALESLEIS